MTQEGTQTAIELEHRGPAVWVWLNRPEVHNAFDAALVGELTGLFAQLGRRADVRVIVLGGRGKSFSAGAQAQWMKQQGAASQQENAADALRLAELFQTIAECPKPTIARVQGAAMGGGVGLVCACDIAIGAAGAIFATSEVKLGLIPATIAPYVARAVGERHARRLFLSGERIDAVLAEKIGLLHEVVASEQLEWRVQAMVDVLLMGAPSAQTAAKELVRDVAGRPITPELMEDTAGRITAVRAGVEAAEGLNAFLQKRPPAWVPKK